MKRLRTRDVLATMNDAEWVLHHHRVLHRLRRLLQWKRRPDFWKRMYRGGCVSSDVIDAAIDLDKRLSKLEGKE